MSCYCSKYGVCVPALLIGLKEHVLPGWLPLHPSQLVTVAVVLGRAVGLAVDF